MRATATGVVISGLSGVVKAVVIPIESRVSVTSLTGITAVPK